MRRREVITLLGAAAAWLLASRAVWKGVLGGLQILEADWGHIF